MWTTLFNNFKTAYNHNVKLPSGHEFDEQKCDYYDQLMFLSNFVQNRQTQSTSVWSNKRINAAASSSQPLKVPKFDDAATEKLKQYQSCADNVGQLKNAVVDHTKVLMKALDENSEDTNFNIFYSEIEMIPKVNRNKCLKEIVSFLQSIISKE